MCFGQVDYKIMTFQYDLNIKSRFLAALYVWDFNRHFEKC
ncbi:hypothetical protein VCRA2122O12_40099 [Vibrio crassostreae]|nr:hypothetical protein VCRA2114E5_30118 [Vibrio crassostreae]CAK2047659.1 hypothetical protein VCRA2117O328_30269 [Vibrio crassostreae]CAK2074098.1 hypothetical protein VCRA2110O4_40098 [Vibrio crassostreae]CAK2079701.1 hypothetical protein VCRA2110O1_40099 [Vibrio crassostreae]CAK2327254.1 hypothetical protein VCRA2110O318_30032 [Vibrio crassostreae]